MRVGIIWMGPAATSHIAPAVKGRDVPITTINCQTIQPPVDCPPLRTIHFDPWLATLGADALGTLLGRMKVDAAYLGAYSAGAGGLEGLLVRHAGDPRILGCYSADAYFADFVKPGYKKQADACQTSGVPFWLSSGELGSPHAKLFADALGMVDTPPPAVMPKPIVSRAKGPVRWLDYQKLYTHPEHASVLAPIAIGSWLGVEMVPLPVPPAGGDEPPVESEGLTAVEKTLLVAGGIAIGVTLYRLVRRRW